MLLVQRYLLTHTFGELERDHGVSISVDTTTGHKFSLNYSQIDSSESDMLANQCRGLILTNGSSLHEFAIMKNGKRDYQHICPVSTRVVAYGFDRFFNLGQGTSAVDFQDPELKWTEKKDGSLGLVHFDQITNKWHVATRGCPEADIPIESGLYTFRTLFEKALFETEVRPGKPSSVQFRELCNELNPDRTYMYEIMSPLNTVVVQHNKYRLCLLGVRDKFTYQEFDPKIEYGSGRYVPVVEQYRFNSIESAVQFVESRSPVTNEGLVAQDSKFNRVKVKSEAYRFAHRNRDSLAASPRNCIELILLEKDDDVFPLMPNEIRDVLTSIKSKLHLFTSEFGPQYDNLLIEMSLKRENDPTVQDWNDRKIFASCVEASSVWSSACYSIYSGKSKNIKEYIQSCKKLGSWSSLFLDMMLKNIGYSRSMATTIDHGKLPTVTI